MKIVFKFYGKQNIWKLKHKKLKSQKTQKTRLFCYFLLFFLWRFAFASKILNFFLTKCWQGRMKWDTMVLYLQRQVGFCSCAQRKAGWWKAEAKQNWNHFGAPCAILLGARVREKIQIILNIEWRENAIKVEPRFVKKSSLKMRFSCF